MRRVGLYTASNFYNIVYMEGKEGKRRERWGQLTVFKGPDCF
jgi:hypothetical protein